MSDSEFWDNFLSSESPSNNNSNTLPLNHSEPRSIPNHNATPSSNTFNPPYSNTLYNPHQNSIMAPPYSHQPLPSSRMSFQPNHHSSVNSEMNSNFSYPNHSSQDATSRIHQNFPFAEHQNGYSNQNQVPKSWANAHQGYSSANEHIPYPNHPHPAQSDFSIPQGSHPSLGNNMPRGLDIHQHAYSQESTTSSSGQHGNVSQQVRSPAPTAEMNHQPQADREASEADENSD